MTGPDIRAPYQGGGETDRSFRSLYYAATASLPLKLSPCLPAEMTTLSPSLTARTG